MLSLVVTQKDRRDVARMHADGDATVARIRKLADEAHRTNHGHSWNDDEDGKCLTCERECAVDRNAEDYLSHKV